MAVMSKIVGILLVMVGCVGCGWYLAFRARLRIDILQDLLQAMILLYGDIEYSGDDISENMDRLSARSEYFSDFFHRIALRLQKKTGHSLYQIWREELRGSPIKEKLHREDMRLLEELGKNLGRLDRRTQLHTLQMWRTRLEGNLSAAREEYGSKAKLCHVLGITVGAFLVVLLV